MLRKTGKWLYQPETGSKSLNKLIIRLFTSQGPKGSDIDTKHEFYRQIFILKNELNTIAGYPAQEPTIQLKSNHSGSYLEGQNLRISGENTIYVLNSTMKKLTMDLQVSEVFESWVEAYLMSLRYLEEVYGYLHTLDKEKIENLEDFLKEEFEGEQPKSTKKAQMVLSDLYEHLVTQF